MKNEPAMMNEKDRNRTGGMQDMNRDTRNQGDSDASFSGDRSMKEDSSDDQ